MIIYNSLCLSTIIYDYLSFSTIIYDCLCLSTIIYEYLRFHDYRPLSTVTYEYLCFSTPIYNYLFLSRIINDNLWVSIPMDDYLWDVLTLDSPWRSTITCGYAIHEGIYSWILLMLHNCLFIFLQKWSKTATPRHLQNDSGEMLCWNMVFSFNRVILNDG